MAEGWHALVAVILATGVTVAVIVLAVFELVSPGHVTGEESTLLSTVLGTMVGAAAGYLGTGRTTGGSSSGDGGNRPG